MIVVRDRSDGLPVQDKLDHFARIHARTVNCTAEQFDAVDNPMPPVDQDQPRASTGWLQAAEAVTIRFPAPSAPQGFMEFCRSDDTSKST
jgi:hypothetical protein